MRLTSCPSHNQRGRWTVAAIAMLVLALIATVAVFFVLRTEGNAERGGNLAPEYR